MSDWLPIESAPKDDVDGWGAPLILIGCIKKGELIWAMAAKWRVVLYGDIHCASRQGWGTDYMPPTALQGNRAKPSGEWICPDTEMAPTHWMPLHTRFGAYV